MGPMGRVKPVVIGLSDMSDMKGVADCCFGFDHVVELAIGSGRKLFRQCGQEPMIIVIDSQSSHAWPELVGSNLSKGQEVDLENFSQPRHFARCIELAAAHGMDFSIGPSATVGLFRKKGTAFLRKESRPAG